LAGKFLRGAFIHFMETFLLPTPNIIIFQFNPESITHSWTPRIGSSEDDETNSLAISGEPRESFQFTLAMDSSDMIADGSVVAETIALASGVYPRLAALEMLMHPEVDESGSLLGRASLATGGASFSVETSTGGEEERPMPRYQLPVVIFVWGPGRIVPVKLTSLSITETIYDKVLLHPTHAEASVQVEVLGPRELQGLSGPLAGLANGAYSYTQKLRQVLAMANLANAAESIIGMLPV